MVCLWDCCRYNGLLTADSCRKQCADVGMSLPSVFVSPDSCGDNQIMQPRVFERKLPPPTSKSNLVLVDVTYDFDQGSWFMGTNGTPVPLAAWETKFPIVYRNLIFEPSLFLDKLAYLPVSETSLNYFACDMNDTFTIHPKTTFDNAVEYCRQAGMDLKTSMTDQERDQFWAWAQEEHGFTQQFWASLWTDFVIFNKTHYR